MDQNNAAIAELKRNTVDLEKARTDALAAAASAKKALAGIADVRQQVTADHSVKARLRALFMSIDPNILRNIDYGRLDLTVRMQPGDFSDLQKLITEPGGDTLVRVKALGRAFRDSALANGTLGPQTAVPFQEEVMIVVSPDMEQR